MNSMTRIATGWSLAALMAAGLLGLAVASPTSAQAPAQPPADAGKQIFEQTCTACHDLSLVTSQRKSRAEWGDTVEMMIGRGAPINSQQGALVADYLAKTYGTGSN